MAFEITDANFQKEVLDREGVTLIDFWAPWCGPCRLIGPLVENVAKKYDGKALIGKVNVDDNQEISIKYGIRSIPTILFIKDGEVVNKHVGLTTQDALEKMLENSFTAEVQKA